MLVKTYGSAIIGVSAMTVTVEVSMAEGSGFFMVGLPDNTEHFIRYIYFFYVLIRTG